MGIIERTELGHATQLEVDLLAKRAHEFAEAMTENGRIFGANRSDLVSDEYRSRPVAEFVISVFDFIDSVDHRTSSVMGGTDVIQNYAREGREAAREFIKGLESD